MVDEWLSALDDESELAEVHCRPGRGAIVRMKLMRAIELQSASRRAENKDGDQACSGRSTRRG